MTPSPTAIPIERVDPAGLPRVRMLAHDIWRSCYAGLLSPGQIEYMLQWMYSPERLMQDWQSGVCFEWPLVDGRPVGYLATELEPTRAVMHLHKLYVLPQYQRRGIGSRLLDHACQSAFRAGCQQVRLHVNKANHPAIACYRRHGFIREAAVVNDIGGGYVMDDYVMVRSLTAGAPVQVAPP